MVAERAHTTLVFSPGRACFERLSRLLGVDNRHVSLALAAGVLIVGYQREELVLAYADGGRTTAAPVTVDLRARAPELLRGFVCGSPDWAQIGDAVPDLTIVGADGLGEGLPGIVLYLDEQDATDGLCRIRYSWPVATGISAAWVEVFHRRIETLASAVLDTPRVRLGEIDVVPPEEWQVIAAVNATDREIPALCIHEVLDQTALRLPDNVALVEGDREVTFAQLNAMVNQVARVLRTVGVGRGDVVGVMPVRGIALIAALFGVLRAGAAYVPLSPQYPADRLAHVLSSSGARVLLVGDPGFADLVPAGLDVIDLTDPALWQMPSDQVENVNAPTDICTVLYTSGTTGVPKGVRTRHDTVVNYGCFNWKTWPITPDDKITQFAPFTFSTAILEITAAIFSGAQLHLITDAQVADPRQFATYMAERRITIILAPPEYANYLPPTPGLRMVETGASECRSDVSEKFTGAGIRHINAYGLTEASVPLVWHGAQGTVPAKIPIGRPVWNAHVFVLDGDVECALYQPGELCVTGLAVADGYQDLPEGETQRFVPAHRGDGVMVRTGDIVQWNADGDIEYFGRVDDQVQIRGNRVELGEVEHALFTWPGITATAAVAATTPRGDGHIVGFVVGEGIDTARLRTELGRTLVPYMVPTFIECIDALPLTRNGKVDKGRLLELAQEVVRGTAEKPASAPTSPTVQLMMGLFAQALERSGVVADTNFFDAGGHSLAAARLVAIAEQVTGKPVGISDLFGHPTPERLAAFVDSDTGTPANVSTIASIGGPGVYPASAAQRALHSLSQLDETGIAHNLPAVVEIEGPIDVERLQGAMDGLVARHESLRTGLEIRDGELVQRIVATAHVPVEIVDIPDTEPATRESLRLRFVRPFALDAPPLFRLLLARAPGERSLLLVDVHHAVADGTSLQILITEFAGLYAGQALAPQTVHGKDFAAWRAQLDLDGQRAWWKSQFPAPPVPLNLRPDRLRPATQGFAGATRHRHLSADLRDRVSRLARSCDATESMVLHAALAALFAKTARADSVTLGIPSAGRALPQSQRIVGMLVNTLPVQAPTSPSMTFREVLDSVRVASLGAFENQDLPFQEIVELVAGPRDPSRNPLFDVMFAYQSIPDATTDIPGLSLRSAQVSQESSLFDLAIAVTPQPDQGYDLAATYRSDLFDAETVDALVGNFQLLLEHVVDHPGTTLRSLPTDTSPIAEFQGEALDCPTEHTLGGLFAHRAAIDAEKSALVWNGRHYTYAEIDRQANALARSLCNAGIGPEDRVALLSRRTPELLVAFWAVMKSGAAIVQVDPDDGPGHVVSVLADSGAKALVVNGVEIAGIPADMPVIDVADPASFDPDGSPLPEIASPTALAYCQYTSGASEPLAAAMIEQRQVAHFCSKAYLDLVERDVAPVVLSMSNHCTDVFYAEVVMMMVHGIAVVLTSEEQMASPEALAGLVRDRRVTHLLSTPSRIEALASHPAGLACLTELRYIGIAGEIPSSALTARITKASNARVVTMYGPAECTVAVAVVTAGSEGPVTVGRPFQGTRIEVLDGETPLGVGVPGELCVTGSQVGRGHLDAEFSGDGGYVETDAGRMYRTGDLARWRHDGSIELIGRIEDQVVVRGATVGLQDIAAGMETVAGVRTAVAVARQDEDGETVVVGYYVAEATGPHPAALRQALASTLAPELVPAAVARLDALPLTSRGMVDRRALPDVDTTTESGPAVPQTRAQAMVAEAIVAVLGLPGPIGADDDFFALGGHSLHGTLLINQLEAATGVRLTLRDLFAHRTPTALAAALDAGGAATAVAPIASAGGSGRYPMSAAQRRLFVLSQIDSRSTAYNLPVAVELEGTPDPDRLRRSYRGLIERHEALRTAFVLDGDEPMQEVIDHVEADVEFVEIDELDDRVRERALREFARPFDLAVAPLIRLRVLAARDGRSLLLFDTHHIVCDAASMRVLMNDLSELYNDAELPAAHQYKDYTVWASGRDLTRQRAYWLERFAAPVQSLDLGTDYPRPARQSFAGAVVHRHWDAQLRSRICAFARDRDATEYMVLLAGVMALVGRQARTRDVVVGSVASGRLHPDTEDMVGMFVETLPLRADVDQAGTFTELLAQVRTVCLDGLEHQEYPFEQLVDAVSPDRDLSRNALFDVMLAYQNAETGTLNMGGLDVVGVATDHSTAKFDLSVNIETAGDGGLAVTAEYATALYRRQTVEYFLGHLLTLLSHAVEAPETAIGRLPVMDEAEAAEVAARHNRTGAQANPGQTVVSLFRAQVSERPARTAIVLGERTVTYADLDRSARRVAAALQDRGVRRGDRVGLAARRGPELYAGILGVMYAGAAYVPIDPSSPPARVRALIEDAGCAVVLTSGATGLGDMAADVDLEAVANGTGREVGPVEIGPDDLAYCLFTSGTTGMPKAVAVEHHGVTNLLATFTTTLGISERDDILAFASITFDASVWDWSQALLTGAALHVVPEERIADAEWLSGYLRGRVTVATLPPLVAREIDPGGLRLLVTAGSQAVAIDGVTGRFVNAYGPTETTVCATLWERPEKTHSFPATIPIGTPIPGARCYVVDEDMHPVGIGMTGEIVVAGAGLARGYLGRDELTAQAFVPGPQGEERVYRTGDLGRWTVDGQLEFRGRIDEQVKVNGVRIEPEEIASALRRVPGVLDATVAPRDGAAGNLLLAAYIVAAGPLDMADVRRRLADALPLHMIPAIMVQIDAIPVNTSGKVDRDALGKIAVPELAGTDRVEGDAEAAVAGAFSTVLGLDTVGAMDDFFALGGDSIKAIRVVGVLREAGWATTVAEIMGARTPRAIAATLAPSESGDEWDQGEVTGPMTTTPVQADFLSRSWARPEHFGQSIMLESGEGFEPHRLGAALDRLWEHHDVLRAVYRDGQQIVLATHEARPVDLNEIDLGPGPVDLGVVAEHGTALHAGMDLGSGPLMRCALLRSGETSRLLLAAHHLVTDGVSWRILVEDLALAYLDPHAVLPAKTAPVGAWADALDRYAGSAAIEAEIPMWREIVESVRTCGPPLAEASHGTGVGSAGATVDAEVTARLTSQAPMAYTAEPVDLLLAALALAVQKVSGVGRVPIEYENHGRQEFPDAPRIDRTVGWFTALHPLVLTTGQSLSETVIAAKEALRGVPRGGLGYGLLVRRGDVEAVAPQLCFNYHGETDAQELGPIGLSSWPVGTTISPQNRSTHPLTVTLAITGGRLAIDVTYDRGSVAPRMAEELAPALATAIVEVVEHCTGRESAVHTASDFAVPGLDPHTLAMLNELAETEGR